MSPYRAPARASSRPVRCPHCLGHAPPASSIPLGLGASYVGDHCRRCVRAWCADYARFERLKAGPVARVVVRMWDALQSVLTRTSC